MPQEGGVGGLAREDHRDAAQLPVGFVEPAALFGDGFQGKGAGAPRLVGRLQQIAGVQFQAGFGQQFPADAGVALGFGVGRRPGGGV